MLDSIYHNFKQTFNNFLESSDFCGLLKTFANSLDQNQDLHIGPCLGPNRLCADSVPERIF